MPLIPKDSKDVNGLRDFLTAQRVQTQACSISSAFSEPLKKMFADLTASVDDWLGKLPKAEDVHSWRLEDQLNTVFSYAAQCAAAASIAALEVSKLQAGQTAAVNAEIASQIASGKLFAPEAVQTATETAIKAKTEAGELVPKTMVDQLCATSLKKGMEDGAAQVRQEFTSKEEAAKTIAARRTLLQAASLPLPESEIEATVLGGTEEEFNARKATFETRREELKKAGVQLNADDLLANLWLEEKAYKGFAKTVGSIPALKFNPNPLATGGGGAGTPPSTLVPVLAAI